MSPVRRRVNPAKLKEKILPYWYWEKPSVDELTRQLNAGPVERLQVHIDAEQHATFVVVYKDGETAALSFNPPINESFVCPPRCP